MADPARYPGAPRWVKAFGIAVGAAVLLAIIVIHRVGGLHHGMPSAGHLADHAAPSGGG